MHDEVKLELDGMLFTWDDNKAAANWRKHKVTFRRAAEVFSDEYAIETWDTGHNEYEDRRSIIGKTTVASILFVVYVDRITLDGRDVYRLISARPAKKKEVKEYELGTSR